MNVDSLCLKEYRQIPSVDSKTGISQFPYNHANARYNVDKN